MTAKYVLWYLLLVAAMVMLTLAFLQNNLFLTVAAMGLALALKATNKYIPLPKVYRDKGVRNELFEGRRVK